MAYNDNARGDRLGRLVGPAPWGSTGAVACAGGDPDAAAVTDFSGAIGLGAQEALLSQLSDLDARRGKLAEAGRQMLASAQDRARSAGVQQVDGRMRQGEVVDTVLEMEPDARLVVLGEHQRASKAGRLHLDHHVERVVRAAKCPVLVATKEEFAEPTHFAIADDGSATAIRMVEAVRAAPCWLACLAPL